MLMVQAGMVELDAIDPGQREKIDFYFNKLMAQKPRETIKAYRGDMSAYTKFVYECLPGTFAFTVDERAMWSNISQFVEHMIAKPYKRSTIERRLSVIRMMLEVMKFPSPFEDKVFREFVTGALDNQLDVDPPKQATPFLEQQLMVANKRGYFDTLGLRNLAMLNLSFDTLLRASELARVKWAHVNEDSAVVLVPKSKTNKGKRLDYRSVSGTTLEYLAQLRRCSPDESVYVFSPLVNTEIIKPGDSPLSYNSIVAGMRSAIKMGGFTPDRYSGHSCRVGAALSMRQNGISLEAIMEAGGWKSASTVHRYLQAIEASYSGSAQLARMSGR